MTQRFLIPKARNSTTGQTVKAQDLSGMRFTAHQRQLAQIAAQQLADKMAARTGDSWVGFLEEYVPSQRRS